MRTKKQQEIMQIGVRLLGECGLRGLRLKKIAEELKVSEPAIYRHFESKEHLVRCILDWFDELTEQELRQLDAATPLQNLEQFFKNRVQFCEKHPDIARLLFSEEPFGKESYSAQTFERMQKHRQRLGTLIEQAIANGEMRQMSSSSAFRILFGSLRLLIKQWCLARFSFSLNKEAESLWCDLKRILTH
ncbi:MAG: hypothetical protein A2Y14_03010 [Verrucomicrobia bacterium GWF2_51_19]|nr:MAG: hypothetical protein A2Y14_03010 [Verrucomicrobia bacterium GWF2_51_19]HCJ11575.1 hypothetical protein [Opitutae bacterium]